LKRMNTYEKELGDLAYPRLRRRGPIEAWARTVSPLSQATVSAAPSQRPYSGTPREST
jgi:hypothetical protein